MPSHGSVKAINKVHGGTNVRVGSRTTAPSTKPQGTTTPAGHAAAAFPIIVKQHAASIQRSKQIDSALQRIQQAYATHASPPGLAPDQAKVLHQILGEGSRLGASKSDKLSAVETGLVESGLRNLSGGDGSSVGWRQETASSYPGVNRNNVKGGADRFFNELKSAPPGSPGQRAQAVQRSAFPGRYDQVQGQASQLLKSASKPAKKPSRQDLKTVVHAGIKPKQAAQGGGGGGKPPYANPAPGQPTGRSDQGVDYGLPQGAPVVAVGKGKVVSTTQTGAGAGWPGGQGVIYKLTKGPQAGKDIYVFEQFSPTVRPGQKLKRGQEVGRGVGGSIETGYYDTAAGHALHNTIPGGGTYTVSGSDGVQTVGSAEFQKQILGKSGAMRVSGGGAGITSSGGLGGGGTGGSTTAGAGSGSSESKLKRLTARQKLAKINSIFGSSPSSTPSTGASALSRKYGHAAI